MSKKEKNIEQLFQNRLSDYSQAPPPEIWVNIQSRMTAPNFIKKILTRFNVLIVISVALLISIFYVFNSNETKLAGLKTTKIPQNQMQAINSIDNKIAAPQQENTVKELRPTDLYQSIRPSFQSQHMQTSNTVVESVVSNLDGSKMWGNIPEILTKNEKSEKVKADFDVDAERGCVPLKVNLQNNSQNLDSCSWNIGDSVVLFENNPSYTFNNPGKYSVKIVGKNHGETYTYVKIIEVLPSPEVDFTVENSENLSVNESIQFSNLSSKNEKTEWDFGDGQSSTHNSPQHRYTKKGIYDVALKTTNVYGCFNTKKMYDVIVKDSKYLIKAPTAFSPNLNGENDGRYSENDKTNDVFHLFINRELRNYKLRIYSKSGILLFESQDKNIGWNGYYQHKPASFGVYVWECVGTYEDGQEFYDYGNITLINTDN
jgi:PKD repeat protein